MRKAQHLPLAGLLCLLTAVPVLGAEQLYDVRDFGAKPDGQTLSTESIQKAIDRCAQQGGGTVYFPPGRFLSGTIHMKNDGNMTVTAWDGVKSTDGNIWYTYDGSSLVTKTPAP